MAASRRSLSLARAAYRDTVLGALRSGPVASVEAQLADPYPGIDPARVDTARRHLD
jgi:hypothetical protein